MNDKSIEKLVIIGSGPAALTAAIYAARANLNPLLIEGKEPGGQLMKTTYVENWPGFSSILGPTLMLQIKEHAKHFGTRFLDQAVEEVNFQKKPFVLITNKKKIIESRAVIIATGATPKLLNCKGEDQYWTKGVSTCAICDGAFYKDKRIVIVGGGDTAMENALFMTNFTDKITIVQILPTLTASYAMQQRVLKDPKIKIIYNNTVTEIQGTKDKVTGAVLTEQSSGKQTTLEADGVFIAIGLKPNTEIFKNQIELNSYGYVILKEYTNTSTSGIFAAGDVADYRYRQAITSAGTGCAASLDAEKYLKEHVLNLD